MKRVANLFNREFSNINQAAFLLGFFALLSQILGLVRDRSLAHFLGPSADLDVYYAAFRIPDFIFISIASLASFTVLIPFLVEKLKEGGQEKGRQFLSNIFSAFLLIMALVSIAAFFLMPFLAHLIAPGFSDEMIARLVLLSRIMLFSPIFLGLSNLFGTVTQILNKFFVYALSPVLYNFGILIGVIFFYPLWGLPGLAIGVAAGALLHVIIQIPVLFRQKFVPSFSLAIDFKQIKSTVLLSMPRTIGLAANNLALLALLAMASLLAEGSISIFNLSLNLQLVPVTIIGVSYSVAIFPTLARYFSKGELDKFVGQIVASARQIIFWSLPVIFLFIVLRAQIVRVILGSGRFTWSDTRLTAAALALFSVSILAQSLVLLLVRGYYAAGRTKRPLYTNIIFSVISVLFSYALLKFYYLAPGFQIFIQSLLRVENTTSAAILMLPLGYSLGIILNFLALWRMFRRDFLDHRLSELGQVFWKGLISSFAIGFVAYYALTIFDNFLDINTFWGILGQGFFSGILGLTAGVAVLYFMKSRELVEIWGVIHTKFWRAKIITPAQENLQNTAKI